VRLQRLQRRPHEVRRAVLPGFAALHHLRPRGRLPVPVGCIARKDWRLRLLVDDGVPRRAHHRLRLRMAEGSTRMGVILDPNGNAARASVEGAASSINDNDPYFQQIKSEMHEKGFLLASADSLINWARTGSLMWMTFGLACCGVEMMQANMPR